MKSTGIIRRLDELGRIVIPKEMRDKLDISVGTPLEIHVEGDTIVIRKDIDTCVFCGDSTDITEFKGKNICAACHRELLQ